ncbi:SIMPL domain-containing protein [Qingshengfaniella alkalisoli]|nr:SIMPL domain-containing protein [Qingshengfaniella alkalisoli]
MSLKTVALAAALVSAFSVAQADTRQIMVSGQGEATAAPDMATIRIGVVARNDSAAAAMTQMREASAALIARLEASGVEARDMQSDTLNLMPLRDRDNEGNLIEQGFEAQSVLAVRVRDLSTLGTLLDSAVTEDGANRLDSLSFGMQNDAALLDEARRAAVQDALDKAALYAEAADVTLGDIQSISDPQSSPRPEMMMRAASMADGGMPIAAGEVGITASVNVVVNIAD